MKNLLIKLLTSCLIIVFGTTTVHNPKKALAESFDSDDYYSSLAVAIDASDNNTFEDNKNPQMFDSTNPIFRSAISSRKSNQTSQKNFKASSASEFSNKYSEIFSSSLGTNINISGVTTDILGKFDTNVNTESWKQQIESYEYYYWLAEKYIVNIDWKTEDLNDALSPTFKRELNQVNSVISAKSLLREFGTHVYKNYTLGGKIEITKYFTQDASYELSTSEKNMAASIDVIVNTANSEGKISGSVNLSKYESNSFSSSSCYSKLGYHAYGGNTNGALTASDLFQYKTQFGTGAESGFLYEAWTRSFNNDGVALTVVSAKNAIPIWDILDESIYGTQISFFKRAWDNMCYESYATKCGQFGIPCDYIDTIEYTSNGTKVSIKPYENSINLPENSTIKINLSDLVTKEFDSSEYRLRLSSEMAATLSNNTLTIKSRTTGRVFNIELLVADIPVYTLGIIIKKESLSGGYGTKQQPFLINGKNDLLQVLQDLSSSNYFYRLSNDIDLCGEKLYVGGSGTSSSFEGVFDGNGYTIKNCTVKTSSFNNGYPYIGFFGRNNGTLKNIILDNVICLNTGLADINNSNIELCAGILTGYNAGVIYNCQIKNSAIRISSNIIESSSSLNVGGIAGYSTGIIEYSAFTNGNIYAIATKGNGSLNVGGIAGILAGSKIIQSYVNLSKINASNFGKTKFTMGGIVGTMVTRIAEDTSIINPKLSMCLVYSLTTNKDGNTFGFISGAENHGEFSNCYFESMKDIAVAGNSKNNCVRKDRITLISLPSAFNDEWVDGDNGPILLMHAF